MESEKEISCLQERRTMEELLSNVKELIQDSDAAAEKEMVKALLQQLSDAVTFAAIGDAASGKTSLLRAVLPDGLQGADGQTGGIAETRHGAQDTSFQVESGYTRHFVSNPQWEGIAAFDIQGLDTLQSESLRQKAYEVIQRSDVLFVLFDVNKLRSFSVWEFLEKVNPGKMVFVITGCDRVSQEKARESELKLRGYLQEEGINAPVFCVSPAAGQGEQSLGRLRDYVNREILQENPVLQSQRNQIESLKRMLGDLQRSFLLRKKQFEADRDILQEINRSMNAFTQRNEEVVEGLKRQLRQVISEEIDSYQNTIIKRLDPYAIKERFGGGAADFEDYLSNVNEMYKKLLNERVSQETRRTIKAYLTDLETVFEEATGFFRKRKNLLALEDRFYGSLAESKRGMARQTETAIRTTSSYYQTLTEASEELFHKIWAAREKHDKAVSISTGTGTLTGAGTGIAVAKLAALTGGNLVICCIVGAAAIGYMAYRLAKACSGKNMTQEVEACLRDFRKEVAGIKEQMTEDVLEVVGQLFANELSAADKSFLEFRMGVNIDEKNIPGLEQKLETTEQLMEQVIKWQEHAALEREENRCLQQKDR